MSRELLVGEGLRVSFGERRVLDVEHISLLEGELLAVLGPNGSGKSTLLRAMAMLEPHAVGKIRYRGLTGAAAERALRRSSTAVLQRPHFWRADVAFNIGLGLRLRRKASRDVAARVRKFAHLLNIGDLLNREVSSLSAGQAQRVALARALVIEPDVLFLDEPTANLDGAARASLREDLERLSRERAGSIFLVTHDLNEALSLADRVAVLADGRVVQVGTPSELYERPADPYVARLTGAELTLKGRVPRIDEGLVVVDLGGVEIQTVGEAARGDTVKVAYRPEDLMVTRADEPAVRMSARNTLFATVVERTAVGSTVRLRLNGPQEMVAVVTRAAAEELGLEPGTRVCVRVKATALHCFPV